MTSVVSYREEVQKKVDHFFRDHFSKTDPKLAKLFEAMRYSLLAGGKRIRPVLVLASYDVCREGSEDSKREEAALRVAAALEMIHTYSLIHDDLPAMDNDDLRRGRPTNHKAFGEAIAILAGDSLLTEAFFVIARSQGVSSQILLEIIGDIALASGGFGMAGGQAIDLLSEGKKISAEELEYLHQHKTGCLIEVSVSSGAKLASVSAEKMKAIRIYAESIGLAFQIADDILDVEGGTAELGKTAGSDAKKDKATYPSILGLEKSKVLAAALVEKAVESLRVFGPKAELLNQLAHFILYRKA